jgi:hypothetical protein
MTQKTIQQRRPKLTRPGSDRGPTELVPTQFLVADVSSEGLIALEIDGRLADIREFLNKKGPGVARTLRRDLELLKVSDASSGHSHRAIGDMRQAQQLVALAAFAKHIESKDAVELRALMVRVAMGQLELERLSALARIKLDLARRKLRRPVNAAANRKADKERAAQLEAIRKLWIKRVRAEGWLLSVPHGKRAAFLRDPAIAKRIRAAGYHDIALKAIRAQLVKAEKELRAST